MLYGISKLLIAGAMLFVLAGCQTVSFTNGYKAYNCAGTGASCTRQGRSGTVAMNGR
jgi:hypothetical protein